MITPRRTRLLLPLAVAFAAVVAAPAGLNAQTGVDIHVVEDPKPENDGAAALDVAELEARGIKPLRAKSKQEMVDGVLGALKEGECLQSLYLYGHGAPGDISTGSGTKSVKSQYIDGNRPEWEPLLEKLKPRLCAGANVYLLGCNVGEGEKGARKLQELADFLGATVHGPIDAVTAGENAEYLEGGRWQVAEPGKPAPTPKPTDLPKKPASSATIKGVVLDSQRIETPHGAVIVHVAGGIAAGDRVTMGVETEPAGEDPGERARNTSTLRGYVVEVEGRREAVSRGAVAMTIGTAATAMAITLHDPEGRRIDAVEVPVAPPRVHIVPDVIEPGDFVPPAIGQGGQPVAIQGPFDGDGSTTEVAVGGEPARVLAERPGLAVVESPTGVIGETTITVREQGVEIEAPFTNLGIDLSIARETLQRGTRETVVGTVRGLDGLPDEAFPLPYVLTNHTPEVVSFAKAGPVVQGSIAREQVGADGTYRFTQPLEAVRPGGFNVSATIGGPGWPPPPIPTDCLTVLAAVEAWKDDDIGVRSDASDAAAAAFDRERERIHQQVLDELGPLAFAWFALDVEPEGVIYERELQDGSCIYQALREAARSEDPETRARAEDILQRGES